MKAASVRHTTCEKEFVEKSIKNGIRLDGRQAYDYRSIEIKFGKDFGCCEVLLGDTRVLAQTSCEMVKPIDSRPTDGQLFLNVDLSPMASPAYESGRMTIEGIEINRLVERVLKESRPIDTESLCVLAGEKVWSVRVDILVLNDTGNILDCCCIAAISALAHFRRPDVTVSGHDVTIHTFEEKEPVPLNVHHMPLCVTFGFIGDGQQVVIDLEEKEESITSGKLMMAFNVHHELCCVQLSGGVCLGYEQLLQCANMAAIKATEITEILKEALYMDEVQRAPQSVKKREGLKTPLQPRDFITKTTAEPSPSVITIDEKRDDHDMDSVAPYRPETVAEYLGRGTSCIGGGDTNKWVVDDDDNDDEELSKPMTHINIEGKDVNIVDDEIDEMDDSEEDNVVIMDAGALSENNLKNKQEGTNNKGDKKPVDDFSTQDTRNKPAQKKKRTRKNKNKVK